MIPQGDREVLWHDLLPSKRQVFFRDLITLVDRATADDATRQQQREDHDLQMAKANAGFKAKIPFVNAGAEAEKRTEWSNRRSWHLSWGNGTDALRSEMRELFLQNPDADWPVLVLDEWDRFDDDWGPQPDADEADAGTKPAPRQSNLDTALRALSRLKGLLADYPRPVILIGGIRLYSRVRRKHLGASAGLVETPVSTLFNHHCFISPLAEGSSNPIDAYLDAWSGNNDQARSPRLSEFLLFEVGPNPHQLKQFLAHHAAADIDTDPTPVFKLRWSLDVHIKAIFGKALIKEFERWCKDYGPAVSAGGYTRYQWLVYLRERLWRYWSAPAVHEGNFIALPKHDITSMASVPPPLRLLDRLDRPDPDAADATAPQASPNPHESQAITTQTRSTDLALLKALNLEMTVRFGEQASEEKEHPTPEQWLREFQQQVDIDPGIANAIQDNAAPIRYSRQKMQQFLDDE